MSLSSVHGFHHRVNPTLLTPQFEADHEGSPLYYEMCDAFGERVAPLDADRSITYPIRGSHRNMFQRLVPEAKVYFVTQEFGTYNSTKMLQALREENRWHHFGGGSIDHPAKRRLKHVFSPDNDSWRLTTLSRGKELLNQALQLAFGNSN